MTVRHHSEPLLDEHWQGEELAADDTQDEPAGWHKRPTWPVRQAPRRDEEPDHNRPRCVHGCYLHDGCRTASCPERTSA